MDNDRYLIRGAAIISQDTNIGILQQGDILVENGLIVRVGAAIQADDAAVIDARAKIAVPGFVDAHRHNWESFLRCTGIDWTLTQYFTAVKKVLGPLYTAEDVYLASYLGALECLDCGITTLFDWFHNNNGPEYADAAISGLRDAGIRAVFGYSNSISGELPVSKEPFDYKDFRRVKKQYFSSDNQLMTLALATRGPQFETMALALDELRLARETASPVAMHVGDGSWGRNYAVKKLYEKGVLDDTFIFIHCNMLFDEELDMIRDAGADTVSCPEVELNMGHGFLPTMKQLRRGIQPGLGVDVVTSVPGDMFGAMRYMLAGARAVINQERLMTNSTTDAVPILATDVLKFATQGSANACKQGGRIGSITPGKQADIVLIDTDEPNMFPVNSPIGAVVEAAHPGNIDTVMVAGRIVKRDKQLLGTDFKRLKEKVADACSSL